MEPGILINNSSKQLTGVSRDKLSYCQDGIHNKFPYLVRHGQLESVIGDFGEQSSEGFIRLKTLYRTQYVVLHHGEREAGNLCREMHRLAFAQIEQGLAIAIGYFRGPSYRVSPVCFQEAEGQIRCEKSVPLAISSSLAEEQADSGAGELRVYSAVCALERLVPLAEPQLLKLADNLLGIHVAIFSTVFRLAELNHSKEIALDVAAGDEADEVGIREPAVAQEVIKADAVLDGVLNHLDGLVGLLPRVLLDAFFHGFTLVALRKAGFPLFIREPLLAVWILALFSMEGKVEHELAEAICEEQREALVSENALMQNMRMNLADKFGCLPCLLSVGVIDNQTNRLVTLGIGASANLSEKLCVHHVEQIAPPDIAVIHKTIEHVFLTVKHTA